MILNLLHCTQLFYEPINPLTENEFIALKKYIDDNLKKYIDFLINPNSLLLQFLFM